MKESKAKSLARPIYGTIAFQPLALLWCLITDVDYWTSIGPFTIYCMFCFIPIYRWYDPLWTRLLKALK